jgi:hypothetical protein
MEKRYAALNLAQIAISLITIPLIMLLSARAFPRRAHPAALIAGWITALYPPLASSPAQRALSEPLAVMMLCLALVLFSFWSPHLPLRRSLLIAAVGGALLGVTALTRAVGLAFLAVVIIWMLISYWVAKRKVVSQPGDAETAGDAPSQEQVAAEKHRKLGNTKSRPILASLVATLTCFLVVAPWTYFNYTQYGSFLLLETANATAYWHYHNFRGEDYEKRLQALPNPADRLSLIVREGTANIIEYPDKALRAAVFAFGYFWHLESNSAVLLNPWDMTQRDPDVPDLLHSDAFFLLIGLTAMAGLAGVGLRRPTGLGGRTLLLINLWLLSMVLLGIIVPYDGRYRLPAAPPLIIFAAGLLALTDWRAVFSPRRAFHTLRAHPWTVALTSLLLAWVLWGAYTPSIPPLLRSLYHAWRGDLAGSSPEASGRYSLAQEVFPDFYWPYRHHADIARLAGRDDEARALYAQSRSLNNDDPYSILAFAQLFARHPDWQLTSGERAWLSRDEADWRGNPWNSFSPSPAASIDIGSGADLPYIRGFHRPDRSPDLTYRWSRGRAAIRLPVTATMPRTLTLRMSAPAVGAADPMPVTLSIDGRESLTLQVPVGWTDYPFDLPATTNSETIWVQITSPTRNPSLLVSDSSDPRELGVGLDSVTLSTGR